MYKNYKNLSYVTSIYIDTIYNMGNQINQNFYKPITNTEDKLVIWVIFKVPKN